VNRTDFRHPWVILILLPLLACWPPISETAAADEIQLSAGDGETYRVQVAAFFSSRRAKKIKRKIGKDDQFKDHKVVIEYSAKSGVYRVEVGEFSSQAEAEALKLRFDEAGYDDAEVVVARRYGTAGAGRSSPASSPAAAPDLASENTPPTGGPETGTTAATPPPVPPAEPAKQAVAESWAAGGSAGKPVVGQATASIQRSDYIIGPEDLLEISVFELEGLNKTVRVSEEGMINLPLLGEVRAEGQTRKGLEELVRNLLEEKYINSPQVSVFIREFRSRSVSVIGSVQKPGTYKLLGARTLIHIISEAGGLADDAGPELYVIRIDADGTSRRITVNIDELMIQGLPEANLMVQAGDVINVPTDPEVSVFIYGAVRQPGELTFKQSDVISLLQAITKAGGLTDRAAADRVRVKRKGLSGVEEQIDINLKKILKGKVEDLQLQDKDVVVVPETIF